MFSSFYINNEQNQSSREEEVVFGVSSNNNAKTEIEENMTSKEIAEIISDKLIEDIKEQFQLIKKKLSA